MIQLFFWLLGRNREVVVVNGLFFPRRYKRGKELEPRLDRDAGDAKTVVVVKKEEEEGG